MTGTDNLEKLQIIYARSTEMDLQQTEFENGGGIKLA
jgi:hypothetical protein